MSKVAIILETRKHLALGYVLNNAITVLPEDWNIQIMHGKLNKDYILEIIDSDELLSSNKHRIILTNLQIDSITQENSSKLLLSEQYWDTVEGDSILVFQCDSILCPESKYKISDFEHFDYIGGYWGKTLYDLDSNYPVVMNGGLSFRKKQYMLDIIRNQWKSYLYNGGNPCEDYFVSSCITKVPLVRDVLSFSIDCGYQAPLDMKQPFGFHKPWANNPGKGQGRYYDLIKKIFPEVETLKNLQ
jgi:hypothetical protein